MADGQRLALRQQHAVDILTDMGEWLKKEISEVLPKSPIRKAIAYALSRWDKLCLYAKDGLLELANNLVENAIRALALGRRNYLFAGLYETEQRIAMFSTSSRFLRKVQWLTPKLSGQFCFADKFISSIFRTVKFH